MTLERRLRQHFDAAGGELSEPHGDLQRVVQRGKRRRTVQTGAVAAGTLSFAVVAVLGVQGMSRSKVEFAPVASPGQGTPSEAPASESAPAPTAAAPSPAPSSSATEAPPSEVATVDVRDLGGSVMTYETWPNSGGVTLYDKEAGESSGSTGSVIVAFPDGRNGFVAQIDAQEVIWHPGSAPEVRLRNVTDPDDPEGSVVILRGVEPDGTVIFSTRPEKRYDEDIVERFFSVALDPDAEPKLLADEGGYEAWYVGPAAVADGYVMASCHLLCSLWPWPEDGGRAKPLYDRTTAIEGLTSTPDGTLVAFVESNEMANDVPQLVVLDAATFKPRLRLELPIAGGTRIGGAVVSMSPDGRRILVSLDSPPKTTTPVPRTTFLVDDALAAEPVVRKVDFRGVVRWHPGDVEKK